MVILLFLRPSSELSDAAVKRHNWVAIDIINLFVRTSSVTEFDQSNVDMISSVVSFSKCRYDSGGLRLWSLSLTKRSTSSSKRANLSDEGSSPSDSLLCVLEH